MNFKKRYGIALLFIVALIIFNQLIIQYSLRQKKIDAHTINISGKQRMLSQRIIGLFYDYDTYKTPAIKEQITTSFEEWETVHYHLINGHPAENLKPCSPKIVEKLNEITSNIIYSKRLLNDIDNIQEEDFKQLRINQDAFLVKMDAIVGLLEKESDEKLRSIINIEIILAILTLFLLFLEVRYIFMPATKKLNDQNKQLRQNNQVLEEYAYIASHDLRTPIQNLINFLGLLKESIQSKIDETESYYLQFIEQSAERMSNTTNDLLSYSVASKVSKTKESITKILSNVLDDLNIEITSRSVEINISEMPDEILVDKSLFRLLLQNLIANGIKFSKKDIAPVINVSKTETRTEYIFSVQDNGIGIPKEKEKQVFKIFQKLHNQQEYKGTGIGLALCERIIQAHNGEIWVESEEGKGSVFKFKLPK